MARATKRQRRRQQRGRKPGATYHHGDLRRALLDATLELVAQRGPEGFTLRAAAKLAGVSDAAPYHHFADKDALLAAVAEEGFNKLYDELDRAGRAHPESPRERARALGVAYVLFAAKNPSHFRVMMTRPLKEHAHNLKLARAAATAFQYVRDALLGALSAEEAARLPTEQLIFGSWGLVHGLSYLAIDGQLGRIAKDRVRLEELVRGVMKLFSRD